jgi:hypothetical protein
VRGANEHHRAGAGSLQVLEASRTPKAGVFSEDGAGTLHPAHIFEAEYQRPMTRTFLHSFDPRTASAIAGPTVDLEVSAIEDAGIREVLQTPGAAYGAWSILDALLTPTGPGTPFVSENRSDRRARSRSRSLAYLTLRRSYLS